MPDLAKEVLEAATTHAIDVVQIPEDEVELLRSRVIARFAAGDRSYPLWDHIEGAVGTDAEDAFEKIADFKSDGRIILFFETDETDAMFTLPHAGSAVALLRELHWDDFYLTDRRGSFLLCYNDHDVLIGVGAAAEWIQRLKRS